MEEQRRRISSVPDLAEVEKERNRLKRRKEYGNALRGTCFSLLAVAAIAVLAATLFLPVLQVTDLSAMRMHMFPRWVFPSRQC